ncbi:hypothetical protein FTX61_02780 [Nitriliruptoraceae bacterium ZYF776]|nr:hypothetical protein [Profundirhabdus halotolerans]
MELHRWCARLSGTPGPVGGTAGRSATATVSPLADAAQPRARAVHRRASAVERGCELRSVPGAVPT